MTITIPPAALEAAARAAHDKWRHDCAEQSKEPVENWLEWHELEDYEQEDWRRQARAAFFAMLEAWPGMYSDYPPGEDQWNIILPLTETDNDKA